MVKCKDNICTKYPQSIKPKQKQKVKNVMGLSLSHLHSFKRGTSEVSELTCSPAKNTLTVTPRHTLGCLADSCCQGKRIGGDKSPWRRRTADLMKDYAEPL